MSLDSRALNEACSPDTNCEFNNNQENLDDEDRAREERILCHHEEQEKLKAIGATIQWLEEMGSRRLWRKERLHEKQQMVAKMR